MELIDYSEIKEILVIRLGKIGDLIISSFIFEIIKSKYPNIKISLLTLPSNKELLKYNSSVDKIFYFNKNIKIINLIYQLRKTKFDLVIDLNDNYSRTSNLLFSILRYRYSSAYNHPKICQKLSHPIKSLDHRNSHIIERFSYYLNQLNLIHNENQLKPIIYIGKIEFNDVKQELSLDKNNYKIISLNLSAGDKSRVWDSANWIELINHLSSQYTNLKFLLLYSGNENILANEIYKTFSENLILKKQFNSFHHFASYIANSDYLISPDTSAIHIASCYNVPTIGLYPNPLWNLNSWKPYQKHYRIARSSSDFINDIKPSEIFKLFNDLYEKTNNT